MQTESQWTEGRPHGIARPAWSDAKRLREVEWLRALSDGELEALECSSRHRCYAAGDAIFTPSQQPESVFLLASGIARIYRIAESGCETSFGYVASGELFGEAPALGNHPRESFAMAVRPSGAWQIGRLAFQRALVQRPELALTIARQISERLKRAEARVEDLVARPVRARVARMLLELAESFGRAEGERVVIDVPVTQGELATLVGATRQTVNQMLGELTAAGMLGHDRKRIVLLDRERLSRVSTSDGAVLSEPPSLACARRATR